MCQEYVCVFKNLTNIHRHTAYGALADVPNNVHLLIAGFSCVDLSKLSRWNKKLTDLGESGDTFRSILRYAKEYRPAIIILENVKTANWKFVKAVMQNDQEEVRKLMTADKAEFENVWDDGDPAYACCWINVDTKNYYIPHTRQRVYMFCISRELWRNEDYAGLDLEKIEKETLATFALKMRSSDDPRASLWKLFYYYQTIGVCIAPRTRYQRLGQKPGRT